MSAYEVEIEGMVRVLVANSNNQFLHTYQSQAEATSSPSHF